MRLPVFVMRIDINGYVWDVVFTDDRRMLERDDGIVTLGVTDRGRMCMFIYDGLRGDMLLTVLRHELCHAYIFSYGYRIPSDYEEMVCGFVHSHAWSIVDTADMIARSRNYKKDIN